MCVSDELAETWSHLITYFPTLFLIIEWLIAFQHVLKFSVKLALKTISFQAKEQEMGTNCNEK